MNSNERRFRPDVEGLRAVAVGLVVLGHAGVPWVPGGYIGVDVFFVLSGFLITGLLVRERATTGSTSMAGFYARRARRILPAASIVLVVTVLASYHWLGFLRGDAIAEDGKWTALFAANLHFAHAGTQYLNITAPPSPLQHYWSLAVEEQFYVVWPLVFVAVASVAPGVSLARKLAAVLALIVVASLAWSMVQTRSDVTWAFFSPLTRAWELAVGALLAVGISAVKHVPGKVGAWLSWGGLGAIIGGAVLFDNRTAFPGYAAALPVLGAAMVVAGGTVAPGRGAERLLALAPFQVLGKWSYSLYLWHWPILMIAAQRAGHDLPLAENLGLMGAAVVLAAVTHYVVENPVRYAPRLTRSPWTSIAVGACLLVAAFGVCAWQLRENTVGSPRLAYADAADTTPVADSASAQTSAPKSPVEEVLAAVAAAPEINLLPADLTPGLASSLKDFAWLPPWGRGCLVDADVLDSPTCVFGDADGSKTVVLLGDSHVAQWMKAFDSVGKELHWKVIVLAKTACPAVSLEIRRGFVIGGATLGQPYPDCQTWLANSIARINSLHPEAVVLGSCNGCDFFVDAKGSVLTKAAWQAGMEETLRRLSPSMAARIIIGDVPRIPGTADCLALNAMNVQACSKPVAAATGATYNDVEQAAARNAGAAFIDVTPWFCGAVCTAVVGNMQVYSNDYHVTATYSLFVAPALEAAVAGILEGR